MNRMLIKHLGLFGILSLLLSCGRSTNTSKSDMQPDEKFSLVWMDEFDYEGAPDPTKWDYDTIGNPYGWGNRELQHYTAANPENARVENGCLIIDALHKSFRGYDFTSARLISKASWQYGRIEVKALLPSGRGTWSAIWMMPDGWSFTDGNWPDVGEIDIMEHVGHETGIIHASAHSKDYQWQKGTQKTDTIHIADATEKFHTYAFEWYPDVMRFYVDENLYFIYENEGLGKNKWPYDKPFYLIMNIAVGGAWGALKGIDTAAFPQTMKIDYVRVYQQLE